MSNERRPTIWLVSKNKFMSNEHRDLMPDDVLCHGGRYRFVDDSPLMMYQLHECSLYIHKTRTQRLANPLEYFSNVLADTAISRIRVDLWVSRKSTRDLLPELNPMWHYVELRYEKGERVDVAQVFVSSTEFSLYDVPEWANNTTEPKGTLVVLPRDAETKDSVVKELGPPDYTIWVTDDDRSGEGIVYTRRSFYVLNTKYDEFKWSGACMFPPDMAPQRFWSLEVQKEVVNVTDTGQRLTYRGRTLRWPYYRNKIYNIVLAFAPLRLPPYVLLEIVDWLPKMDYQSHHWKIDLIMSMQNNIQEIYQERERGKTIKSQRVD